MNDIASQDMQLPNNGVAQPIVSTDTQQTAFGAQPPAIVVDSVARTPSFIAENIADQLMENVKYDIEQDIPLMVKDFLSLLRMEYETENNLRSRAEKFPIPTELPNHIIAKFMANRGDIALIGTRSGYHDPLDDDEEDEDSGEKVFPIGIYQHKGPRKGTYKVCNDAKGLFGDKVAEYKPCATTSDKKEVFTIIRGLLPTKYKCNDPYLTITGNCIFDMKTKTEIPFSPDFVFTSKIRTNLNRDALDNPPNVYFEEDGTYFTVDEFITNLSGGDYELVRLFWEIMQAICLPLAPRNKAVLLYNKSGNNGKGTFCELLRSLIGVNNTAHIPISEMSKEFGLENLGDAFAIVVDENDTNTFSEKNATLKALITGDSLSINKKNVSKFDMAWKGLMVQCLNSMPKIADKTGSMKRRLLFVPMPSNFQKSERKYIKEKFVHMKEVREHILARVLIAMDYRNTFYVPSCSEAAMKTYEMENESVSTFCDEILPQCKWDLLPATDFLYAIYKQWYKEVCPSGKLIGRNDFIEDLKDYIKGKGEWEWTDSTRSHGYIDPNKPEPLLIKYALPAFRSDNDPWRRSFPTKLLEKYSGLKRCSTVPNTTGTVDN